MQNLHAVRDATKSGRVGAQGSYTPNISRTPNGNVGSRALDHPGPADMIHGARNQPF